MRSNLIRYLSKLNPKLNCQEPKLDSQLRVSANKAVAPSSWVHWFLCQLFAHGKKTPSGRCRRRATGRRVCSRSRPGCRRSAPRLRGPSTTLSLLQSPNWRLSEPHHAHTAMTWHDGEREVLGFWACSFILKNIRTVTDWHSRLQRDKPATRSLRAHRIQPLGNRGI